MKDAFRVWLDIIFNGENLTILTIVENANGKVLLTSEKVFKGYCEHDPFSNFPIGSDYDEREKMNILLRKALAKKIEMNF